LDARGRGRGGSKAKAILNYLKEHCDRAFFSKDIAEALKGYRVKPCDVMANVRRFEGKGLVYVRGYKTEERQTPSGGAASSPGLTRRNLEGRPLRRLLRERRRL